MDYVNLISLARVGPEHESDIAAYAAAQALANGRGESVLTVRLGLDGQVAPGQEGVWSEPDN